MNEQERHELFDRYLQGNLDEQELDRFLKDLEADEELEKDFQTYRLLVEGIRQHEKEELLAYMRQEARVRFMGNPWSRTWTIASAAVVLLFGVLYITMGDLVTESGPKTADNQQEEKVESKQEKNKVDKTDGAPEKEQDALETPEDAVSPQMAESPKAPQAPPEIESVEEEVIEDSEEAPEFVELELEDRMATQKNEDQFPVKEDIMLYDTALIPRRLSAIQTELKQSGDQELNDSSVKTQSQALTGAAKAKSVRVEFWKSPINYSGYRYDGKRVQLYGTYNIEEIELISYPKNIDLKVYELYLRIGQNYYKLEDNNEYNKLKPIKDDDLLKRLK